MRRLPGLSILIAGLLGPSAAALEQCSEMVRPLNTDSVGRFSLAQTDQHTDWVTVRFIVDEKGAPNDIKPIAHSADRYLAQASEHVRALRFMKPERRCYRDLTLYQVLSQ